MQALAGDSVDNVPGVPGIGIKTAAQLIVEYGDLDTLLFRAGEIKQPKRREALIANAEKARISRQLVLLDDCVKLDVPLDELAVHEPDARKLIAFLKAMEFSTLTRRVADYAQIDPADVEADTANKSGVGCTVAPLGQKAKPSARRLHFSTGLARLRSPAKAAGGSAAAGGRHDKAESLKGTPIDLAAARAEAVRKIRSTAAPIRPSAVSTSSTLDRARPRNRACRGRGQGQFDRSDAGGHLWHRARPGAQRRLLHSARAAAVRRWHRPVRCRPRTGPDQAGGRA